MNLGPIVSGLILFSGVIAAIAWIILPFLRKKQE